VAESERQRGRVCERERERKRERERERRSAPTKTLFEPACEKLGGNRVLRLSIQLCVSFFFSSLLTHELREKGGGRGGSCNCSAKNNFG